MSTFFAGLDWASRTHAVCVIDEHGRVFERLEVTHDGEGLAALQRRLRHWHSPPIAIERPSGLLVDTLVEGGFTVVPIHPNAVSRPRGRATAVMAPRATPPMPTCWPICCAPMAIASER
jgi:hypothetical protein